MFRPDCPRSLDKKIMPTDQELDKHLASSSNGTRLDQLGTRFTQPRNKHAIWETTEKIRLQAGDTLVFPPNWFHRIPPQSKDAAHSGMSIVVKYYPMPTYEAAFQLSPPGIDNFDSEKVACYKLLDLYRALSNVTLDVQSGLPRFPCVATKLHDMIKHDFSNHKDEFVQGAVLHPDDEF